MASTNPIVTLHTTKGPIRCEIYLDRVPRTASSFIDLCRSGFYDGLHFHRVIPGFMNQFGCPYSKDPHSKRSGTGGPPDGSFKNLKTGATERRSNGGNIQDENIDRTSNKVGTLSMANTGSPNSGGSQFFVNVADNKNLDWFSGGSSKHPVFGAVADKASLQVALAISKVRTRNDCPVEPVKVKSCTVENLPGAAIDPTAAAGGDTGGKKNPIARFETSMGVLEAEIYLDRVPRTASNFIDLCRSGFYNGLHFHRVIPGFMNQFGCPYSKDPKSKRAGTGGPKDGNFKNLVTGEVERRSNGGNIKDENIDRTVVLEMMIRVLPTKLLPGGTLSMANTGAPNSGGSQFFLNVANNKNLDWFTGGSSKHPVFGKLVGKDSIDVAIAISKVRTRDDNPIVPVLMKSVTIVFPGAKRASDGSGDGSTAKKQK